MNLIILVIFTSSKDMYNEYTFTYLDSEAADIFLLQFLY